jgi:hypothetical protein
MGLGNASLDYEIAEIAATLPGEICVGQRAIFLLPKTIARREVCEIIPVQPPSALTTGLKSGRLCLLQWNKHQPCKLIFRKRRSDVLKGYRVCH